MRSIAFSVLLLFVFSGCEFLLEQPYDREKKAQKEAAARQATANAESNQPRKPAAAERPSRATAESTETEQSPPPRKKAAPAEATETSSSEESAPPPKEPAAEERPAPTNESAPSTDTRLLERQTETFTGKVVMVDGAYRLSLTKEPNTLVRLTRGRRASEFEREQILLRKYYEKIIAVNGTRQGDWIWGADIIGQWLAPGAPTGPNMNAPKETRP